MQTAFVLLLDAWKRVISPVSRHFDPQRLDLFNTEGKRLQGRVHGSCTQRLPCTDGQEPCQSILDGIP